MARKETPRAGPLPTLTKGGELAPSPPPIIPGPQSQNQQETSWPSLYGGTLTNVMPGKRLFTEESGYTAVPTTTINDRAQRYLRVGTWMQ